MRNISTKYLTDDEKQLINKAVEKAELKTSGEIVPVLATQSDNYDRGLFSSAIFFVIVALIALVGLYFFPIEFLVHNPWSIPLYVLLPVQIIAFLVGYNSARNNENLHRAFIEKSLMQRRVDNAAHRAFNTFKLSGTRDATGIMIYVSLFEKMVVVVADKAINEKHDKSTWDGVRDLLVQGLKEKKPGEGFSNAIAECGKILEKDFPIKSDDTNELPNNIRLI